jgi:hypothetical protein
MSMSRRPTVRVADYYAQKAQFVAFEDCQLGHVRGGRYQDQTRPYQGSPYEVLDSFRDFCIAGMESDALALC